MLCLDITDTLEGGASVTNVVDYTVHGLVAGVFTNIAQGQLSDTNPTVLYTAGAAISIVSITFVNTHSAAVTVDLYLDPANAGTPRRMIPKAMTLGVGYSMHFDGQRCSILDSNGGIVTGVSVSDIAYAASWDGVTTIAPSKNAVYDQMELKLTGSYATAAEITTGMEAAKAIAPDQLLLSSPTVVTIKCSALGALAIPKHVSDAVGLADTTIMVSANNEMTNASQPAFLAQAQLQSNVLGNGVSYVLIFGTEIYDQGANFDGISTFTAPVTGRYHLSIILQLGGLAAANVRGNVDMISGNRSIDIIDMNVGAIIYASEYIVMNASCDIDMDASDTVFMRATVLGGTQIVDVLAGSYFSGHLIC